MNNIRPTVKNFQKIVWSVYHIPTDQTYYYLSVDDMEKDWEVTNSEVLLFFHGSEE